MESAQSVTQVEIMKWKHDLNHRLKLIVSQNRHG